ncbi:MAG TPA: hypothetical protein VKT51_04890 [Candidatus Eremiobacteraceae bacterium]|nr:hypothetical protein [Candidatus Eremiobacteraceae bacterium]
MTTNVDRVAKMRIVAALVLSLLAVGSPLGARGRSEYGASPPSPTPAPASTECWIYKAAFPATRAAFESQHVTRADQAEIEKWARPASPAQTKLVKAASPWAAPPTAAELGLVRWMRDAEDGSILVFVERPLFTADSSGYSPWLALNTNMFINPVSCEVGAYPTA